VFEVFIFDAIKFSQMCKYIWSKLSTNDLFVNHVQALSELVNVLPDNLAGRLVFPNLLLHMALHSTDEFLSLLFGLILDISSLVDGTLITRSHGFPRGLVFPLLPLPCPLLIAQERHSYLLILGLVSHQFPGIDSLCLLVLTWRIG